MNPLYVYKHTEDFYLRKTSASATMKPRKFIEVRSKGMKVSILGPGGIAHKMAYTIQQLDGVEAYAVASRSLDRATAFAEKWGFKKAYGSYEELAQDPEVELVYICTPHSHHYQYAKMCLEHGKHILVEKAFTANAKQAEELLAISKEKNLLVAEAIWPRYMPSRKMIDDLLAEGAIGEPISMVSNFGFPLTDVDRLTKPELAGGALLDLTVYPITAALMAFHGNIVDMKTTAVLSPEGIDWMNNITLTFDDGKMAILHGNMLAQTDCDTMIFGTEGCMKIRDTNNYETIRIYNDSDEPSAVYERPEQISGFEYEVLSCKKAIEEGKNECPEMPHAEIMRVMKLMDQAREVWGMKFPWE